MASEVGDLFVVLRAVTEPFTRSMREAAVEGESSSSRMGGAFQKLTKIGFVAGAAAAAIAVASVKMAADFESSTTRLVTSAGESEKNLDLVRRGLLAMAGQVGVSATALSGSLYFVEAAGFHAADGLTVLKAAAQGAAAEGADTTVVAKALTDILVDYHLKASSAADITSKMVTAVAHGKTNLQEFSGAFASIVPAASAAGISFQDVMAALANMTNHGFTATRASQNLAQALRSLLNPTKPMTKAFDEFGVSSATLKQKLNGPNGLTDAMEYLSKAAAKAGTEGTPAFAAALKRLMGTAPGANAALATVGANFKATSDTIKAVGGSTADAQGKVQGFALVQTTLNQRVKELRAGFDALGIKLGTVLMPYVEKFVGWLQQGVNWLVQHKSAVLVLAGALGTTLVAAIVAVGGALVAAIGWAEVIAVAVMAAGAAVVYAYTHFKTFRTIVNDVGSVLKTVFVGALHLAQAAIKGLVSWWQGNSGSFSGAWRSVLGVVQGIVHWFNDNVLAWIRARIADLVAWWQDHGAEIAAIWRVTFQVMETAAKAWWDGFMKPLLTVVAAEWKLMWGVIRDTAKLVWSVISSVVTMTMHNIMNVIGLVLDIITGKWSRVWGDLKKLVSQAISGVLTVIKNLFSGAGTLLWNAGQNVIKGLIGGIRSMVGGVANAISGVTSTIRNHLPFSPAKVGPLSGSGSPDIAGRTIGRMIATGLSASVRDVRQASGQVAGAAALAVTGGVSGVGALAVAGGGGGFAGNPPPDIVVNIDGRQLFKILQRQALRNNRRNPTSGLALPTG